MSPTLIGPGHAADGAASSSLEQALLQAQQALRSASIREEELLAQVQAVAEQEEAARLALQESRARYIEGITPYLSVLTALSTWQAADLKLIDTRRQLLATRVDLYLALGGASAPQEGTP